MQTGAKLEIYDKRNSLRQVVDYPAIAEHRTLGDIKIYIINMSSNGFMTEGSLPIGKGERLSVRLPVVGEIEAHVVWSLATRSGLQFERIIRPDEFGDMITKMAG